MENKTELQINRVKFFEKTGFLGSDQQVKSWASTQKLLDDYGQQIPTNKTEIQSKEDSDNNGGSTDYYKLPAGAIDLQDLIEYKNMNFSQGNIFKAVYRLGNCTHSDAIRDLNKIIWFVEREIKRIKKNN